MTAYVNDEQKKEGAYGKAVKATLAATLAAGMVPAAAAFADEPQAETEENADAELLWNSYEADFAAGKVTKAVDQDGNELKVDEKGNITVTAGAATTIYVQEYTTADGVKVELGEGNFDAGKWELSATPHDWSNDKLKEVGTYKGFKVKVKDATSNYSDCESAAFNIVVEKGSLDGVALFNAANGNEDVTKASFSYSAAKFNFGLAKDGAKFADAYIEGVYDLSDVNCKTISKNRFLTLVPTMSKSRARALALALPCS